MSEELTLLQKLMTSKPPTRRITLAENWDRGLASSKPPTRRITTVPSGAWATALLSRLYGG